MKKELGQSKFRTMKQEQTIPPGIIRWMAKTGGIYSHAEGHTYEDDYDWNVKRGHSIHTIEVNGQTFSIEEKVLMIYSQCIRTIKRFQWREQDQVWDIEIKEERLPAMPIFYIAKLPSSSQSNEWGGVLSEWERGYLKCWDDFKKGIHKLTPAVKEADPGATPQVTEGEDPAENAYRLIVGPYQELTKKHALDMFKIGVVCGKDGNVELIFNPQSKLEMSKEEWMLRINHTGGTKL